MEPCGPSRLCGISTCFQVLSPCTGQVTHALLTRPPLMHPPSGRNLPQNAPVRLACVRHAASVHPEPGSNSHVGLSAFPASSCRFCWQVFLAPLILPVLSRALLFLGRGFRHGCSLNFLLPFQAAFFRLALPALYGFSGLHCCSFAKVRFKIRYSL